MGGFSTSWGGVAGGSASGDEGPTMIMYTNTKITRITMSCEEENVRR